MNAAITTFIGAESSPHGLAIGPQLSDHFHDGRRVPYRHRWDSKVRKVAASSSPITRLQRGRSAQKIAASLRC
jgi:hypothetical protein